MCTVVVSIDPEAAVPVVLVAVRDEVDGRAWAPPAPHWPEHPDVLGGRDLQAGGTWLAVAPEERWVATVLNGLGLPARGPGRRSRGELPLRAVREGNLPELDAARYDPFHLLLAGSENVRLWQWDGRRLTEDSLPPGTHMIVNGGWERGDDDERVAYFRPRFHALARPTGIDARPSRDYWANWLPLATGAGLPTRDARNIIIREELFDGQVYTSLSSSLIALAPDGVRYDFSSSPRHPAAFHQITPRHPGSQETAAPPTPRATGEAPPPRDSISGALPQPDTNVEQRWTSHESSWA
ncbi:NRDE family protein [Streptomyces sp. NPDC001139]